MIVRRFPQESIATREGCLDWSRMIYSPAGGSDLFSNLSCATSNVLYLNFSTLHSSSLWRTDTIFFAKLNKPPPHPQSLFSPPGGLNRGFMVPRYYIFKHFWDSPLVTDMFVGIVRVSKPYFVSLPTLMATCLGITSPRWRRKRQFVGPVCGQTWVPGSITEYLIYRKEWLKKWGIRLQT